MDRYHVWTPNNSNRHFILEATQLPDGNITVQRVDNRKGGYTDLAEAKTEANTLNKYGDKPHPEMCLCDWCAYERFCLTGERD